jgi:competence protein ComEA
MFIALCKRTESWVRGSRTAKALSLLLALLGLAFLGRPSAARAPDEAPVLALPPAATLVVPQAPPDSGASAAPQVTHSKRATPDDPVFLNEADEESLSRLPGVGPKRAKAILEQRRKVGRFRHLEELLRVKGIGRSTLKKLRPLIRLDSAPLDAGT